jgi:hypothetical protein
MLLLLEPLRLTLGTTLALQQRQLMLEIGGVGHDRGLPNRASSNSG